MTCVRPFGLQHAMLVNRLQNQSTALHLEQALTRPRGALWAALLGHGSLAEGPVCTVVFQAASDSGPMEGFAQARLRPGGDEADMVCIAPSFQSHEAADDIWRKLISGMALELARHGVQRVFARLSDELEAARMFLDAGFSLYTREDIFHLHAPLASAEAHLLEPARDDSRWGIARLYTAVTPNIVRAAEGLANTAAAGMSQLAAGENSYVWHKGGEIVACARLVSGPKGHWLQILVHPDETPRAEDVLRDALAYVPGSGDVYCSLRAYQGNLRKPLQDVGFRFLTSQSVLVRQNVLPVREAQTVPATALEKRAEARTPTAMRHDV
jgi:hypothetical protein